MKQPFGMMGSANGRMKSSSGIGKMKILPAHHYTSVSTNETTFDSEYNHSSGGGGGGAVSIEMQEVY